MFALMPFILCTVKEIVYGPIWIQELNECLRLAEENWFIKNKVVDRQNFNRNIEIGRAK